MENFSAQDFENKFEQIFNQELSKEAIKDFLLNLNRANLPQNAFIGAVKSLRSRMKTINAPDEAIDIVGTGGDKLKTLNISSAVSFVVAAGDIAVAKHGNKAASSSSGAADVFMELGIKFQENSAEIERCLSDNKLCFLFAPLFHQSLKSLIEIRKELGVATIFNFLGPLLNPANTSYQMIGSSRKDVIQKMLGVLENSQHVRKAYVVHGFDGMDEITICDRSYLFCYENGEKIIEEIIDPEKYGIKKTSLTSLIGSDAKYNAQKLIELLAGEKSPYREIVVLNCAFAFRLVNKVKTIEDGIDLARSLIDSGKAKEVLFGLQKFS